MKKMLAVLLVLLIVVVTGISAYAYVDYTSDETDKIIELEESQPEIDENLRVNVKSFNDIENENNIYNSIKTSFPTVKDEIYYKMLNSMDYFTTAEVAFSAKFPGSNIEDDYYIKTNLNTGISYQSISDNLIQTRSVDVSKAYETYSDGQVVREFNNLVRTVQTVSGVEQKRTLAEEWPNVGIDERYYVDENGEPHFRYRGNPTNASMAGECLLPQVSAFAYLIDQDLWEVVDTINYCDRECYFVEGLVDESYSAQIGAETFMMYVDKDTGILLKLEACDANGDVVSSMVVSEISIDAPMTRNAFEYDMSKYEDYTELPSLIGPQS